MRKKILVTGGAGFIGSHLCERLLQDGHEVVSLDNFNDFYDPSIKRDNVEAAERRFGTENFRSYTGDIRNEEQFLFLLEHEKPHAVIHLAAMAGVRPSLKDPGLYVDVNVRATQILLDACAKKGVDHFVFASSSSVYGNNTKVPFSESDFVDHPISPYAATKKAGELLCHTYSHLYSIKTTCLRFFTVYGPRQRPDLAIHKFAKRMLEGKTIPVFGNGETRRDYTYIDDIVDGVVKALQFNFDPASPRFEVFNLGESATVTLSEMIAALEKVLGVKAKIERLPMEPGDVECTYADISKSKRVLGYNPVTPFERGVEKFAEWIQKKEMVGSNGH